ncbi:PTS sugar transporter subunit IIC [Companilactobacillus bobalius]|uniref:Permease IIC component n=1 Tax=Companilactobacillus bobalius TaxID=2801451 RepID=A0A202FFA4_9LACO|nr:PTS transporter subunit EIIC [Companilactobacillus bobalius]KAE9560409.1 hypothetical protein ATN92_09605 [Companilactobacillus bobalius]OVE99151.1 Lichenan permease IIC component [Companilactobacillus bobalius]GEO57127.1 permease IIC component [Companilactobacillus paralimentarius]
MFNKFKIFLSNVLGPLSSKFGNNKVIQAVVQGCIDTVPVTIGVSLITILINLPISSWKHFLLATNIYNAGQQATNVTLSLLPIYLIVTVSNAYSQKIGMKGMSGVVISIASFLILIPSQLKVGKNTITALTDSYLGSKGIFLAMVVGILITYLYGKLMHSKLRINLPDSVPPMVANSLASSIPAVVILSSVFVIKVLFLFTSKGNLFDSFNAIIQTPLMTLGTSPAAYILFSLICNLLWFFGVHPASLTGFYTPVVISAIVANMQAFNTGKALPYGAFMVVYLVANLGGFGGTLGFCCSLLLAKSKKYKELRKVLIIPNLFNINEPIIFGVPLVMNPVYFLPMILSQPVAALIGWGIYNVVKFNINPAFQLGFPWVTPPIITAFAEGGIIFALIIIFAVAIHFVFYYPFFKYDDNKAFEIENK